MSDKISSLMELVNDATSRKLLVSAGSIYAIYELILNGSISGNNGVTAIVILAILYVLVQGLLDLKGK